MYITLAYSSLIRPQLPGYSLQRDLGNSALLCQPYPSLSSMLWTTEGHGRLDISVFHVVFIVEAWQQLKVPFLCLSRAMGYSFPWAHHTTVPIALM